MKVVPTFPIPKSSADIHIVGIGGGLDVPQIYDALISPTAEDWQYKTGVVGATDGSAKTTLRLLCSQNWIFKTHANHSASDFEVVHAALDQSFQLTQKLTVWHPQKVWFTLFYDQLYWPCTATPRLITLRELTQWEDKVNWWTKMLDVGLEIVQAHHIMLDINPSNFGYEDGSAQLYYLDDEVYQPGELKDIGEALAHRIPQEPQIGLEQWRDFGDHLASALAHRLKSRYELDVFVQAVGDYFLVAAYYEQRDNLIAGLRTPQNTTAKLPVKPTRYCLFSDVHANLPALERVLQKAKELDVDGYIFLGDAVGYGPFPKECIERIANLPNLMAVRGNHDETIGTRVHEDGSNRHAKLSDEWTWNVLNQAECDWLRTLPLEHVFENWMLVHGSPQDPHKFYGYVYEMTYKSNLELMKQKGYQIVFHGHNHIQFVYQMSESPTNEDPEYKKYLPAELPLFEPKQYALINPGSAGQPRDGDPRAAFAIWDVPSNRVIFQRVDYPIAKTMKALLATGLPDILASRLEAGR